MTSDLLFRMKKRDFFGGRNSLEKGMGGGFLLGKERGGRTTNARRVEIRGWGPLTTGGKIKGNYSTLKKTPVGCRKQFAI